MTNFLAWLEAHDNLAGWAQFFGAMLALAVTYFTAFAPAWRRKRQLQDSARRLLAHGYEVVESYHRTSAHFDPFPLSIRQASLTMGSVVQDLGRFPIYELDDQGSNSLARRLVAMGVMLSSLELFLEAMATELEQRPATDEDQETLRDFVGDRLSFADSLITGAAMTRPEWPS